MSIDFFSGDILIGYQEIYLTDRRAIWNSITWQILCYGWIGMIWNHKLFICFDGKYQVLKFIYIYSNWNIPGNVLVACCSAVNMKHKPQVLKLRCDSAWVSTRWPRIQSQLPRADKNRNIQWFLFLFKTLYFIHRNEKQKMFEA